MSEGGDREMAADPAASERVYRAIRLRLMEGAFRLDARLDVGRLAQDLRVSATPVREALTRLASERLVSARPARGFFATLWSKTELEALYAWRGALLRLAVETRGGARGLEALPANAPYANRVSALFEGIEEGANPELRRAARNADDHLHPARHVEPEVFADCEEELAALAAASSRPRLHSLLKAYHARRVANAAAIRERAALRAIAANGV